MKIISRVFKKISWVSNNISMKIDPPPPLPPPHQITDYELTVQQWFAQNGDRTLRIDYDLNPDSIVFDIGGYEGQWASDIFSKYQSNIFVFEPVDKFSGNIKKRFLKNSKIKVFPFGLGNKNGEVLISLNNDASSTLRNIGDKTEIVKIVCVTDFITTQGFKWIDLMKINIEGGEFDLLENLIETGGINSIGNIQVQFHEFVENAIERRDKIHNLLKSTHYLTYEYPFVWENWAIHQNLKENKRTDQ